MIIKSNIQIHSIRKERIRLSDSKGIVILFRAAQNLGYLMKAKMQLKGEIHDTLDTAHDNDATVAYDNIDDANNSVDC